VGIGVQSIIKQQVFSKHFELTDLNPTPVWAVGLLNVKDGFGAGQDFYITRYGDFGEQLDSVDSRTFIINRSNGHHSYIDRR
jgi:hypothetical protein